MTMMTVKLHAILKVELRFNALIGVIYKPEKL